MAADGLPAPRVTSRGHLPLVSIIIPTHNRARMIGDAVRSCLAQTYANVEVIVVDDGSTDDTAEVLAALSDESGGALRTVFQTNAGASAARNAGLDVARGTYVQFLDSDDVLAEDKIALQIGALEAEPTCEAVLCYGRLEQANDSVRVGVNLGEEPMTYVEALCGQEVHVVQTSSPLWRLSFLSARRRWNPAISLGDDLEFHVRCLVDATRVTFMPRELFTVRRHTSDRLSDYSVDNRRLASLLTTRVAMFEALAPRGRWTRRCARNALLFMRSLYVNYLYRMSDAEVIGLERLVLRMGRLSPHAAPLLTLIALRRSIGRRAVLAIVEQLVPRGGRIRDATNLPDLAVGTGLGATRRAPHAGVSVRRASSILRTGVKRLSRFRLSHTIAGFESLRRASARSPEPGTVLLVEPNCFHAETLPGYISLLAAAGYKCWLAVRPGVDVDGALSRLPAAHRPTILRMNLRLLAIFLRSRAAQRFDLVFFSSGTIAEPHTYFGGVLEYLGQLPRPRLGYLMIEHSDETLRARADWLKLDPKRLFALAPVHKADMTMEMLAPVEFGRFSRPALSEPRVFVTVGRIAQRQRNFAALVRAVKALEAESVRTFRVVAIGARPTGGGSDDDVGAKFEFTGFQAFAEMYERLETAHFFLPLLDSSIKDHSVYLSGNTTGSRQLVLGFEKIGLWERPFAEAYGFSEANAIVYEPGELADGIRRALALDPVAYAAKVEGVARLKRQVFQTSLDNLKAFLMADEHVGAGERC